MSRTDRAEISESWIDHAQPGEWLHGPNEPNGVLGLVCSTADDAPALRCVVLDAADQPVHGTFGPTLEGRGFRVTTDARGWFAFLLGTSAGGPAQLNLIMTSAAHAQFVATAGPDAQRDLPAVTLRPR